MSIIATTVATRLSLRKTGGHGNASTGDPARFFVGAAVVMVVSAFVFMGMLMLGAILHSKTPEQRAALQAKLVAPAECAGRTVDRVVVDGRYCRIYFTDGQKMVVRGVKYSLRTNDSE